MATFIRSSDFTTDKAWGAQLIANMNGITMRLHRTDKPYKWHINDGEEVFVVLDGTVEMKYRQEGEELSAMMQPGGIFFADIGTEHVTYPQGEARVLVVETEGSV
ncbi:cupin [Pseudovibrio denitrificans]|uniref:cupin n=1 Tax=Pseudovibrio denitrificans TaxID=258256 RepID=UPI0039BF7C9E